MMNYTGHACPCCNKPFTPEDDIVVCPECGAPYHRACYQKEGRCLFEGLHSPDFAWKPAPSESAPVTCSRCGAGNAETATFCTHCGARLQEAEEDPYERYYDDRADTGAFLDPLAQLFRPGETLHDIPVQTWAAFLGASSPYYLFNFKRMEQTGRRSPISFSAFVLGPIYFFYRKMYKWGFLFGALTMLLLTPNLLWLLVDSGSAFTGGLTLAALQPLVNVSYFLLWGLSVLQSLVALRLYRDTALQRIRIILDRWKDEPSRRAALNALGGTSIGAAICYGLLVFSLFLLVLIRLGGPKIYAPLYM